MESVTCPQPSGAKLKVVAVKGLAKHPNGGNLAVGNVRVFQNLIAKLLKLKMAIYTLNHIMIASL